MQRSTARNIAVLLTALAAGPAAADPLAVAPQVVPLTILGIDISVPVSGQVDVHTEADKFVVKAHVTANLADLQAKALQIAKAIPLPTDRCANKNGVNAVVNSIDGATIAAGGNDAKLSLSGTVSGYLCFHKFGVSGYTDLGSGGVRASADVKIVVTGGNSIGIALDGPVSVDADGITGAAIDLLRGQVTGAVTDAVGRALDRATAKAAIPNLSEVQLSIGSARFAADGNTLMLDGDVTATMSAAAFATLLAKLGPATP